MESETCPQHELTCIKLHIPTPPVEFSSTCFFGPDDTTTNLVARRLLTLRPCSRKFGLLKNGQSPASFSLLLLISIMK